MQIRKSLKSVKNLPLMHTFENHAIRAAVVGFQFRVDLRNQETILVKMM
jgi:hypothetical protein